MNVSTVTTEQSELSDKDVPSGEDSEFIDQPVTELVTAQVRSNTDFPNGDHGLIIWLQSDAAFVYPRLD